MLQIHNLTKYEAGISLLYDREGAETLYVSLKATFRLDVPQESADEPLPLFYTDEYWDDPLTSSIRYPTDAILKRAATDVILNGSACAPNGKPVKEMTVSLRVANKEQSVQVFGDRFWERGMLSHRISEPIPFERMPLLYERAFGGRDTNNDEKEDWEARNPVGMGFRMSNSSHDLSDVPLPNLEHPKQRMSSWKDRPTPAGFGALAPWWEPRRSLAGTYDDAWQKQRSPFLPTDFHERFLNAAHPDLICDGYLQGGEPFHIEGVRPDGPFDFALPKKNFRFRYLLGQSENETPNDLELVFIETDEQRFAMVWRAAILCEKRVPELAWVLIEEVEPESI